ncbi:helix-turn-helix transcriptional regulator [uncultured Clostridium sp.]|uniref:helix-turn-helix transcriptional regulator n=1 Tax=uncultured Clostridium sp. TaxID=59620 RepID=UPI002584EC13|nr:helix-turn-helix transcriptional regulator [uncultured Clostridium sp.]
MDKLVIDAGKLIKYKRKVKGYSTQELAKLLNVSPGLINNIENAKTDTFNIELLYKISSTLDIPVTDILSYNLDAILTSIFDNLEISSSLKFNLKPLLKALIQLSNNQNLSSDKIDMFLKKLVDDINFYNKLSSL